MRRINAAGLALVQNFEGCRLLTYDDLDPDRVLQQGDRPRGTLTIGHGHTGPDVHIGQRISAEEARRLLEGDLDEAQQGVERLTRGLSLSDNAFAALVSLAFNIGLASFRRSSLLKRLLAGDRHGAAAEFARWNKAGGRVLPGLVRRRAAEAALFLEPDRPAATADARPTATPDGVATTADNKQAAIAVGGAVASGAIVVLREAQSSAAAGMPGWLWLAAGCVGLAVAACLIWKRSRA